MMHPEILSEAVSGEFYTFSDCPSDIYTSISEDDSSSEHSSDSDDMHVDQQEDKKP